VVGLSGGAAAAERRLGDAAIWHDVECASYDSDLPLWRALAAEADAGGGAHVLDLGCGTGRVAIELASRGHHVTGLDCEPSFTHALATRARARGLRLRAETADARSFSLAGPPFDLAIAPMQVAQLLGGADGRAGMLECTRRHLRPGGRLAVALADPFEGVPEDEEQLPPLPDVREEEGWVYSSVPTAVREEAGGATAIDRLRQAVSPDGELAESMTTIVLDSVAPEQLEREALASGGWSVRERRQVPATADYVGSVVVVLEAAP
jgi:SAM-dependent methyltransferase